MSFLFKGHFQNKYLGPKTFLLMKGACNGKDLLLIGYPYYVGNDNKE